MRVAGSEELFQDWYEKLNNFIDEENLNKDLTEKIPSLTWLIIEEKVSQLKSLASGYQEKNDKDNLKLVNFILTEIGY